MTRVEADEALTSSASVTRRARVKVLTWAVFSGLSDLLQSCSRQLRLSTA